MVGDLIMSNADWYINLFCLLFGIKTPHTAIYIGLGQVIDTSLNSGVRIISLDSFLGIYKNVLYFTPNNKFSDTDKFIVAFISRKELKKNNKYSVLKIIASMFDMIFKTRGSRLFLGDTCNTLTGRIYSKIFYIGNNQSLNPIDFKRMITK